MAFAQFGIEMLPDLQPVPDNPDSLFEGVLGFGFFLQILQTPTLHNVARTLVF